MQKSRSKACFHRLDMAYYYGVLFRKATRRKTMLHIVLVEPEIPQNTGNIARTCAVTGAVLHLVQPLGFTIDDKKLKRAGLDYWHALDIRFHKDFEALATFSLQGERRLVLASTHAAMPHSDFAYRNEDMLVFGKETAGLGADILKKYGKHSIRIPMRPTLRSLNLSNSAAIVTYEALRQLSYPGML